MNGLENERIKTQFLRISGMRATDFCHDTLIENAASYIAARINTPPAELDGEQRELCEYAAAAVAVYDYAFEACLRKSPVMGENGEVTLHREDDSLIRTARSLRRAAMNRLVSEGLAAADDFAFVGCG